MANAIKLTKLTKTFGKKIAVDNVSLNVARGEIFGFLGPNGAGKTTTIRLMMDFIRPSSGKVQLLSRNVVGSNEVIHSRVGFLSADAEFYPQWNAQQHIDYLDHIRGGKSHGEELANRFGLDTKVKYHRLSSGNKQKLGLILSMMHDPELLILDEPTRGLDPLLQVELYDMLKEFRAKGGTVFTSSHNLSEVERVCDRVGIIRGGKLVANETMASLRKLHMHEVRVSFVGSFIVDVFKKPDIEIINATKRELVAHVRGDLNRFLGIVAKHRISDLEITHVSLEDMFMRYYQE